MKQQPNAIHAVLAMILLPLGGLLILGMKLGGTLLAGSGDSTSMVVLLSLFGGLLWIWGCTHLAITLKINPAFGFLGVFFLVGLAVMLWIAKKQPEWERAAARHRARHGKKQEHRGDPNSLY